MSSETGQPLVTALQRGLAVLRCFDYSRQALGSSEIARLTGLPQPTVWRLCKTLEQEGYLVADTDGARFRPGLPVLTLGYAALATLDLAELARPYLQSVADAFNGAAGLSTRDRLSMLFLQRCEGVNAVLTINLRVGSEVPMAASGTGWGYLAGLDATQREKVFADFRKHAADLWRRVEKPCRQALDAFPKSGYVVNADVMYAGLTTVAVPVGSGDALFVVNHTALSSALATDKRRREVGAALIAAARKLEPVVNRSAAPARKR